MRLIAFVAMLIGILMAFVYPAWVDLRPSGEVSRYSLQTTPGIAGAPTVDLERGDAPVAMILEIGTIPAVGKPETEPTNAAFRLALFNEGKELRAETVRFQFQQPTEKQSLDQTRLVLKKTFFVLDPAPVGPLSLEIRRVDEGAASLASAELSIHRNYAPPDDRVAPAGFLLLVLGGIGFVLARRRKPQKIEPRPPRENKWGR